MIILNRAIFKKENQSNLPFAREVRGISIIKSTILWILRFYKRFISPFLGVQCRFYPTCSTYSMQAIEKYGVIKGLTCSFQRLLKCHPFHPGGIDMP